LTVTPEQLVDFAPWVLDFVLAHDAGLPHLLGEPPHPLAESDRRRVIDRDYLWSAAAEAEYDRYTEDRRIAREYVRKRLAQGAGR
jgi:hypothetical protein